MKLIEILVRDLHKFGGWPAGAVECQHFVDEANIDFYDANGNWEEDCLLKYGAFAQEAVRERTQPCQAESVTREQYEAALAASKGMLINKPQPVWNGEGRPPVGVKCEHCPGGTTQHQWEVVTVVAVHENLVSGFTDYWLVREDGSSYLVGNPYRFRPIRTEAERKREEVIDELVSVFISHHGNPKGAEGYRSVATKVYDKVISKKLEAPDDH